jgi:pre-mRNA-splicing factor ATP-dependent RNA helicase DHX15/PRP43
VELSVERALDMLHKAPEPLMGFIPGKVVGAQVLEAMVGRANYYGVSIRSLENVQSGDVNPFTKKAHSPHYENILQARRQLPVFGQMAQFLRLVR